MPITTRADGDVITASSWNANVRDQVVSTTTSAARPGGTEGQVIVETDTDLLQVYSGSTWVQFGGYGAWTSYTPSLLQGGTPVTKTVTYAKYQKIGRLVAVNLRLDATGAGTANAGISITTPFTAVGAGVWTGGGVVYDASATTIYPCISVMYDTTHFALTDSTQATTVNLYEGQTGTAFSVALASGDAISLGMVYESTT